MQVQIKDSAAVDSAVTDLDLKIYLVRSSVVIHVDVIQMHREKVMTYNTR